MSYVAHFSRMDRIRHYHIGCNEEVRRDTPVVGIPGMNKMTGEHWNNPSNNTGRRKVEDLEEGNWIKWRWFDDTLCSSKSPVDVDDCSPILKLNLYFTMISCTLSAVFISRSCHIRWITTFLENTNIQGGHLF